MKVLAISQFYEPDITAAAFRISETVTHLVDLGYDITVITSTPHKSDVADYLKYDDSRTEKIVRASVSSTKAKTFSQFMAQYLGFVYSSVGLAIRECRKNKPDIVWISSPPLPIILVSLVLKVFFRVPIVLDIRDIWPESAVNMGRIRRGGLVHLAGKVLEYVAYKHADLITCVSQPMKMYLTERVSKKVEVIYNGVNTHFEAYDQSTAPQCVKRFCYAGNIGFAQDVHLLLEAFDLFCSAEPATEFELMIIGDGALLTELRAHQVAISNSRVIISGAMSKQRAFEEMTKSAVLLLPLKPAAAFGITIPSKLFDYLLTGRPVIANIQGEGAQIVESNACNRIVEAGSAEAFASAMLELVSVERKWEKCYTENIDLVEQKFSRLKGSETLSKLFRVVATLDR